MHVQKEMAERSINRFSAPEALCAFFGIYMESRPIGKDSVIEKALSEPLPAAEPSTRVVLKVPDDDLLKVKEPPSLGVLLTNENVTMDDPNDS